MSNRIVLLGNSAGWCGRSWEDLRKKPGCILINKHFPCDGKISNLLVRIHYSKRVNNIVNLPLKKIWYSIFLKNLIQDNDNEMILIVYDGNKLGNDEKFLQYLKSRCRNLKMAYIITNEVQYCIATRNNFYNKLKKYYNIVYGFHIPDKEKYGIDIIPLVYSRNEILHGQVEKQVFFAGESKSRLPRILSIYRKVKSFGFSGKIIALHVDENTIKTIPENDKEIFFNRPVSYDEILKNTQESAVIIEVPQEGLQAITIKTCEAVYYNKLLITTNPLITQMPFYDPRYMLYIESEDEITEEFLQRWDHVEYKKNTIDYFSVETFLSKLFNDLKIQNMNE